MIRCEISPICSSVKLFSPGWSVTSNARLRPSALSNRSNSRTPVIASLSLPRIARSERVGGEPAGTMKAKSRVTDWSAGGAIGGAGAAARARRRDGVEIDFRRDRARRRVEALREAGMKLAEAGDDRLRAKAELGRAARVPGRPGVGEDLQIARPARRPLRARRALRPWRRTRRTACALPDLPAARPSCRRRAAATASDARRRRDSGGRPRTAAPRTRRGRGCGARRRSGRAGARAASPSCPR